MRVHIALLSALLLALSLTGVAAAQGSDDPSQAGRMTGPFSEVGDGDKCVEGEDGQLDCAPAAGALAVLTDGRLLYWNALEGTENVEVSVAAEFGSKSINDQSRIVDISGSEPVFFEPTPVDGGSNPDGVEPTNLIPEPLDEFLVHSPDHNDGSLFCTDLVFLPNGEVLVVGGTSYYHEPAVLDTGYGFVELEGLRLARRFDPERDTWVQAAGMEYGRWYPSMVTMADGRVLTMSGVTKLIKPLYPDSPTDSGRNVVQQEVYDPDSGTWSTLPDQASRSLPLYPRVHLLPNGEVFYNAAGQTYNPAGEGYDQALWNIAATFDPATNRWTDLGIPGLASFGEDVHVGGDLLTQDLDDYTGSVGGLLGSEPDPGATLAGAPGFRGSTFSVMLPLVPPYDSASFLTAGGVLGTTPGTYLGTDASIITTVDLSGDRPRMSTESTDPLNDARWYPSGVALPDGSVLAINGATVDEVVAPGTGMPVQTIERFDPADGTWTVLNETINPRTYHNTAALLPDGRVMIAGHATISTLYGNNTTIPGGFTPQDGRDPSFEIYEPPYLFAGDRPAIRQVADVGWDRTARIVLDEATDIDSVVAIRNPAVTHVFDNDQRTVSLEVLRVDGPAIEVALPGPEVLPPGPYMLFVNAASADGPIPSEAFQIDLGG